MRSSSLEKVYWHGNAAKTKLIDEVLRQAGSRSVLIFDYGCGAAGDWPRILSDHPNLKLVGSDPDLTSLEAAKDKFRSNSRARFFTDDELMREPFKADFIVSFSVFEHVYDREAYLNVAKDHLAENGLFYLNYDDGHFRLNIDFSSVPRFVQSTKTCLWDVTRALRALAGRPGAFQKRVRRNIMTDLIEKAGFETAGDFYSNLASLKDLFKTIPADKQDSFMRFWVQIENEINEDYRSQQKETLGDTENVWQVMPSRTLILRHKQS